LSVKQIQYMGCNITAWYYSTDCHQLVNEGPYAIMLLLGCLEGEGDC